MTTAEWYLLELLLLYWLSCYGLSKLPLLRELRTLKLFFVFWIFAILLFSPYLAITHVGGSDHWWLMPLAGGWAISLSGLVVADR
jgi:hypothetical protein